jgi:hypothetical protein
MPSVRAQHKFAEKVETFFWICCIACLISLPLHASIYSIYPYLSCNYRTPGGPSRSILLAVYAEKNQQILIYIDLHVLLVDSRLFLVRSI